MQKSVSPVTAVIIVLVALAIAGFAWMRMSEKAAPKTSAGRGGSRGSLKATGLRPGGMPGGGAKQAPATSKQ